MNQDDIIRMAKEAGFMQHLGVIAVPGIHCLEHFAALVVAAEREKCAKEWVSLGADEEIIELSKDAWGRDKLTEGRSSHKGFYVDFARLIERKLKEKNHDNQSTRRSSSGQPLQEHEDSTRGVHPQK